MCRWKCHADSLKRNHTPAPPPPHETLEQWPLGEIDCLNPETFSREQASVWRRAKTKFRNIHFAFRSRIIGLTTWRHDYIYTTWPVEKFGVSLRPFPRAIAEVYLVLIREPFIIDDVKRWGVWWKNMHACSSLESWPWTMQNDHLFFMRYWRHNKPRKGKEKSQKNALVKNLKGGNYNVKSLERTYEDNNECSPHNARDVISWVNWKSEGELKYLWKL